ncbi:MAG: DUF4369 domain-containing protein [Flavobacteriaceae bacterium]|nr:DUF4369 domain-containing protein [Flavobacteriaceae bacterium]
MKRIFQISVLVLLISACSGSEPNVIVNGQIRGLKKGTLYLEQQRDTSWVVIDSMLINGQPDFLLQASLDEPEVLNLRLDVANTDSQRLRLFAAPGIMTVKTSLKRFFYDAKLSGSSQQELMNKYNEMMNQFSNRNLELIRQQLEAGVDSIKSDSIKGELDKLMKRKYLYAINFAMTNKNTRVAPYIALSEIFDTNVKYLDTIYKALPDSIAQSKYGTALENYIQEVKTKTE